MATFNKFLSEGIVTSGTLGATGVMYFKPWKEKISVKQELKRLGKTIITSKKDSRWGIKTYIYKKTVSSSPHLKINGEDTISKDDLSSWCIYSLKKPNSKELHDKAKIFCLAPSVKDKLSKNNKTIASSLTTQIGNYKSHNQEDDFKIPRGEMENKEQGTLEEADLKKWCNAYSEIELSDGEDKNYSRIEKWCTQS